MEKLIRSITDKIISKLPPDTPAYTPSMLIESGIPDFLVRQIKLEITRALEESLLSQWTDWLDTDHPDVVSATGSYVTSVLPYAMLPSGHARGIIESAVESVLEQLVRPRSVIPALIYGDDATLDATTLEARTERIAVYRHLAMAPARYSRKKNLDSLTREQCQTVIARVDEKLIESYNALDWVHLIEPLFQLAGDKVDTELLRLFFEDKQLNRVARHFDLIDEPVSRMMLIEQLASPELLALEGVEQAQTTLFDMFGSDVDSQSAESGTHPAGMDFQSAELDSRPEEDEPDEATQFVSAGDVELPVETESLDKPEESETLAEAESEDGEYDEQDDVNNDDGSLYSRFMFDDETEIPEGPSAHVDTEVEEVVEENELEADEFTQEIDTPDESEINGSGRDGHIRLADFFIQPGEEREGPNDDEKEEPRDSFRANYSSEIYSPDETEKADVSEELAETAESEESDEQMYLYGGGDSESHSDTSDRLNTDDLTEIEDEDETADDTDSDDVPIWQQFASEESEDSEDENETYSLYSDSTEDDSEANDSFPGPPQAEIETSASSSKSLMRILEQDREEYITILFGGAESSFNEAVEDLASIENWKTASAYIEENIFFVNRVDMFNDTAVNFTDHLHDYFLKR